MRRTCWRKCEFGKRWNGVLSDEARAHPAKFNRGPLEKFVAYGFDQGWWKTGDAVGDPMAGVGCGYRVCTPMGLDWYGMEVNPEYVAAAQTPKLFYGDSRVSWRFWSGPFQAIITSPPYGESLHSPGGCRLKIRTGTSHFHNPDDAYGDGAGQVGRMKGDDYWAAMEQIYRRCLESLMPGGRICLFVRDYVRKGKVVRFTRFTRELLTTIGFEGDTHIRLMMGSHASFFRRLNAKKGLPVVPYEHILVYRKPDDETSSPNSR